MADSDSDYASDHSDAKIYCRCIYRHDAINSDELSLNVGDMVRVTDSADSDWWWGECNNREGWFSTAFVRVEESSHPLDLYKAVKIPSFQKANPYDSKFQRKKIKVIDELLANETEYVSSLSHVVDQYMAAAAASKLFTKEQLTKIFGNIKSLYEFHLIFHKKLRRTVTGSDQCSVHELVNLFQSLFKHFYLYKAYCTKFDESAKYLQKLYSTSPAHAEVLDKCRSKDKSMVHLPLSSYLLCPVQRICKYPLQIEALARICEDESTKATVANLATRFRDLLDEINEEKRKNEVFLEIDTWQNKVHQWTGPSLKHTSSELVFYSEGILYQSALKESVMLYLFDNQLVFCARTGDGGLKLKNRFDLARTSFSAENGLFRIYEKQDGLKSCALMQVYIKNKKDREKWQFLLKLEIGFAKIKHEFEKVSENLYESTSLSKKSGSLSLAAEICKFIRQCNKDLKIHLKKGVK